MPQIIAGSATIGQDHSAQDGGNALCEVALQVPRRLLLIEMYSTS